jgi:predicted metal-dependent peptidase
MSVTPQMPTMSKARSKLLVHHPFFATLVLSTPMVIDLKCRTAWCDMERIGYNPVFIESLPFGQVIFVIVHEVMHKMLKHGLRRGHRNPKGWNFATDYAINYHLKWAGFELWPQCLYDERFANMGAEQIYDILKCEADERRKQPQEPGDGPDGQPGDNPSDGDDEGAGGQPGFGSDAFDENGWSNTSCGMDGDVREPEGLDAAGKARIEQGINQQIAQAATMGRLAGKMPKGMDRLIEGILNPPLPWYSLLRDYLTQISHDDENWSRRKRQIRHVYLPSHWSEAMGEIVVIGDTSGSMGNAVFAQTAAEINAFIEMVNPERTRVIWADDTDCALEEVFEQGDEVLLHPKGGGGTDMRKPLKFVEKYEPIVVVLITDGETPWPVDPPPYPLIVLMITDGECPVGKVVRVKIGQSG